MPKLRARLGGRRGSHDAVLRCVSMVRRHCTITSRRRGESNGWWLAGRICLARSCSWCCYRTLVKRRRANHGTRPPANQSSFPPFSANFASADRSKHAASRCEIAFTTTSLRLCALLNFGGNPSSRRFEMSGPLEIAYSSKSSMRRWQHSTSMQYWLSTYFPLLTPALSCSSSLYRVVCCQQEVAPGSHSENCFVRHNALRRVNTQRCVGGT
ncbi:hypothetical protein CC86DRAFT_73259 [Ophiobolus disseminans]|uniref:Uncharacterized protein n=1 Tax=Ophiobolus disseminans TaxID=1469910 RepID=A0A6A6ZPZ4_9PLEO|nr:hypothetical protein CC86DRAFT_73259 [Ophiobolus disseminans]